MASFVHLHVHSDYSPMEGVSFLEELCWAARLQGADTLALTVLIHLGKMFPAFCYRRKASFRERLAVSIARWPRGEVGAGVLVISIGYGIGGPVLTIAMLSLALNLLLTGAFIVVVKRLLADVLPSTQAS